MRNQSYSFNVFAAGLALAAILLGFLAVPRLMQHVSAQEFNSTGSSKTDDIKGVGVIAFDAPNYRSELAKFLGDKAKSYPEALQRYGLIVTNNTSDEIVGYTVRTTHRANANAKPVTADLYLHDAIRIRNIRQYNIKPGEKVWIGLLFAVNEKAPAFPEQTIAVMSKEPIYAPETVIQSIVLDSVLVSKSSGPLKIVGPDKLDSFRKIKEERRAFAEVAELSRLVAENANGQGKSLQNALKEENDKLVPAKSVSIDGPTGDWYLLRKKMLLRRGMKLSERYPANYIAETLNKDLAASAEVSK